MKAVIAGTAARFLMYRPIIISMPQARLPVQQEFPRNTSAPLPRVRQELLNNNRTVTLALLTQYIESNPELPSGKATLLQLLLCH